MARIVECSSNQWTVLLSSFAAAMPYAWEIEVNTLNGGLLEGVFEEKKSLWIFSQPPEVSDLTHKRVFYRGWINTLYRVRILPKTAVRVVIRSG